MELLLQEFYFKITDSALCGVKIGEVPIALAEDGVDLKAAATDCVKTYIQGLG